MSQNNPIQSNLHFGIANNVIYGFFIHILICKSEVCAEFSYSSVMITLVAAFDQIIIIELRLNSRL